MAVTATGYVLPAVERAVALLAAAQTREQAMQDLAELHTGDLRALARHLDVAVSGANAKEAVCWWLVEATVGARLDAAADHELPKLDLVATQQRQARRLADLIAQGKLPARPSVTQLRDVLGCPTVVAHQLHDILVANPNWATSNQGEARTVDAGQRSQLREVLRETTLRNALRKRANGVPTYSVPEAAVLLSISQEYLYRLIQAGGFPAVRMRIGGRQGRYVVPAKAVEKLLDAAADANTCIDAQEWTERWQATTGGDAA